MAADRQSILEAAGLDIDILENAWREALAAEDFAEAARLEAIVKTARRAAILKSQQRLAAGKLSF